MSGLSCVTRPGISWVNFRATCSGFLLDLTAVRKCKSSSGLRGPLHVGRDSEARPSSSVWESSHSVESVSVVTEVGVEGLRDSVSRAWEVVGVLICIGEVDFRAILRVGEGDLRGIRRGVFSGDLGEEVGGFLRFATSENRREGAGGEPQMLSWFLLGGGTLRGSVFLGLDEDISVVAGGTAELPSVGAGGDGCLDPSVDTDGGCLDPLGASAAVESSLLEGISGDVERGIPPFTPVGTEGGTGLESVPSG